MKSEEDGIGLATCSERGGMMTARPKTTWRRMVERESRQERWTSWAEVRGAAQDMASGREKEENGLN